MIKNVRVCDIRDYFNDTAVKNGLRFLREIDLIEEFEEFLEEYGRLDGFISEELIYDFFYNYLDVWINEEINKYRDYRKEDYVLKVDRVSIVDPFCLSQLTIDNYRELTGRNPARIEE